jgi:uncharacterized protein involved in response to NO
MAALWGTALAMDLPVPPLWHAHELVFGFGLAAVTGFALTAIPEFTGHAGFAPSQVRALMALWLLGRLGFWLSAWAGLPGQAGLLLAALAHTGLLLGLAARVAGPLWTGAGRRHLAFLWALLALAALTVGFYADALRGIHPARWLDALVGLLMMLIIVAMSRISMRIVNRAIEQAGSAHAGKAYLARPPRRHLAMLCIGLYTAVEFAAPGQRIGGWLALSAAAAMLNLQADWHVGLPLLRRWPLMLYAVYAFMALGYGAKGASLLLDGAGSSAARHLLAMGALGLNIYAVICIAGRAHCGLALDESRWVAAGAGLIAVAALLRATAGWYGGAGSMGLMALAGACWSLAFGLLLWRLGPVLLAPRADGRSGC